MKVVREGGEGVVVRLQPSGWQKISIPLGSGVVFLSVTGNLCRMVPAYVGVCDGSVWAF
jgi:hypothetical protein